MNNAVRVTVVDHPLAAEQLGLLRDIHTPPALFRAALDALAGFLVYEACRELPTVASTVTTPLGDADSCRIATVPLLVPVLRAGLGMLQAALRLLPAADTGFVGVTRNEATHQPTTYVTKLPEDLAGRACFVLDPMLATAGSMLHTCQGLIDRGAATPITAVCVLAAPEGIDVLASSGLDMHVVTAAVDSHLNEHAYIVPGLGDAGDRQFGAPGR